MKKILLLITALLALGGCATAQPDGSPVQVHRVVHKIYTPDEAKQLTDYKQALKRGENLEAVNGERAFISAYSDVNHYGKKMFPTVLYVPPHLRGDIELGIIVRADRYTRYSSVNRVVPRAGNAESYQCVIDEPFFGIVTCIDDLQLKKGLR